jgi:hypothetical protein
VNARIVDLHSLLGLKEYLEVAPENTRRAMSMAMNDKIGGTGLSKYRAAIGADINLPASYIRDRFNAGELAKPDDLTVVLRAERRPTSLARFIVGGAAPAGKEGGIRVRVNTGGSTKRFRRAFTVGLNNDNMGLAVRLEPGQVLNKRDTSNMIHLEANVVLLYGPGVDQVLETHVADEETPGVLDDVTTEFYRQFARLQSDG